VPVRSTKVTSKEIEMAPALALIVRAGAGVNTIDLAAASARAIAVSNCPGKNSVAVAELAWGLILALDRRIPEQTADPGASGTKTSTARPGDCRATLGSSARSIGQGSPHARRRSMESWRGAALDVTSGASGVTRGALGELAPGATS
jgi:D-3-phosphoglycerate dehydrogenase